MLEELFNIHHDLISDIQTSTKRYLFDQIHWENKLNMIVGMRGVGKTTLLLQYIKENFQKAKTVLYISGDNTILNSQGLFWIGKDFYKNGGKLLIIDEAHKYPSWNQELKNLYDSCPKLKLIASGSSSLDIIKGQFDLSRRSVVYYLNGLSFREFLNLTIQTDFKPYTLQQIIKHGFEIASNIKAVIEKKDKKIFKLFKDYLRFGYYPYFLEQKEDYFKKVQNSISKVLYEDIPSVFKVKPESIPYLHKLIYLVASSNPLEPNISRISRSLGISKEYVYNYIDYLDKAGLFNLLYHNASGLKFIRKPQKIYLDNSNLYYTIEGGIVPKANLGSIRESFALNQLQTKHKVFDHDDADFFIDNKYVFEIGGKNKNKRQIKGKQNAFILKDDIEIGYNKESIPLYLLGFIY